MIAHVFDLLVYGHIATGALGIAAFWVPVIGRKGGPAHRRWGKVFAFCMLATGTIAIGIATCTILAPLETHTHVKDPVLLANPELIRGIFGWMMLYLAILTINLAWYGWLAVTNKRDHAKNREPLNLFLQGAVTVAAANCAWQGVLLGQFLMVGISFVGFATAATNLWFIYSVAPAPQTWLKEHVKALVGAGISVYTAFFAFGAVRLMPALALNPAMWAVPLTVGLAIIVWHRLDIDRKAARQQAARATP